jgi:hypothetical protein
VEKGSHIYSTQIQHENNHFSTFNVVVYNVELDEIFVISNVTVSIVPIIPYANLV